MPYDIFRDSYADEEPKKDSVKDVVREFRQRYKAKYPQHSPDELGNFVTLVKILGKLRKEGVTVQHMRASIDTFYERMLDRSYRDHPAWKKWLWCVRDTRPKDEGEFVVQQERAHAAHKPLKRAAPADQSMAERALQMLPVLRKKLELAMEDEELFLANNGQQAITTLKSSIAWYEGVLEKEGRS